MSRAAVLIGTILVAAATARADPQAADRVAAEAEALARAKDFRGAAAKFREAYAADPRPDFMCNVGVAYHKAQELPRAQLFLSRCLERGSALDGKFIDLVRAALAKLEASLKAGSYTPVDVVVEPRFATVSIDAFAPDETFDGGRTIWLAFASYRVTVRADGYQPRTVEVTAKDRAMLPLRIALERRSREDQDDRRARAAREREVLGEVRQVALPVGEPTQPLPGVAPRAPANAGALADELEGTTGPRRRRRALPWLVLAAIVLGGGGAAVAVVMQRAGRYHATVEIAGVALTKGMTAGKLVVETDGAAEPADLARLYTSTLDTLRLFAKTDSRFAGKVEIPDPVDVLLAVPARALCEPSAYLDHQPPKNCASLLSATAIGARGTRRLMVVSDHAQLVPALRKGVAQAACEFSPVDDNKLVREICDVTARFAGSPN